MPDLSNGADSGNNSLRGGKKSYTRGALEGNWTEDRCDPKAGRGHFTTSRFVTVLDEAMRIGHTGKEVVAQEFGCGISRDPSNDRFDHGNIVCPDKKEAPAQWKTIMTDASEYKSKRRLGEARGHPQLEAYRAQWTKSTADEMDYRFSLWKQGL
jgi:hypothetical protein